MDGRPWIPRYGVLGPCARQRRSLDDCMAASAPHPRRQPAVRFNTVAFSKRVGLGIFNTYVGPKATTPTSDVSIAGRGMQRRLLTALEPAGFQGVERGR